jgi:heat shock protein HslJ/uncharacterized lipoprotein YbaY
MPIRLACAALLAVLAAGPAAAVRITAPVELAYRERIALPPDATAEAVLRVAGREIARAAATGGQVPIRLQMTVPAAEIGGGVEAVLEGRIRAPGLRGWRGERSVRLAPGEAQPDLGTLLLARDSAEAAGLYRASGNEPAWILSIEGHRAVLSLGVERREIAVTLGPGDEGPDGLRRLSAPGETPLRLTIAPGPCRDSMSGVAFPDRVTVEAEGMILSGCGGTLASRLTGPAWTIIEIAGRPAAGRAPVTLRFDENGRAGGQGPCNLYRGEWRLEGERLVFGRMVSTMMACPEPEMAQEQALHRLLQSVTAWRIGEQGELVIEGEGGALVARR